MSTTTSAAAPVHVVPFSIRVLRRLKPLVVALLSSPLHGLLSRDVLLLRYRGRRSGRAYELPLSYVEVGGAIHLCTRPEGSDWWRYVKGGAAVEATVCGRVVSATAEVLDAASPEALEGLGAFVARNPRTGELLYKVAATPAGPSPADLAREVKNSIVVRLTLKMGTGTFSAGAENVPVPIFQAPRALCPRGLSPAPLVAIPLASAAPAAPPRTT